MSNFFALCCIRLYVALGFVSFLFTFFVHICPVFNVSTYIENALKVLPPKNYALNLHDDSQTSCVLGSL